MNGIETSDDLLHRIVAALAPVRGVEALVLGGSRGRGVHHAASDYDIGLYYRGAEGIDFDALNAAVAALDDGVNRAPAGQEAQPLMTGFGGWGPWVNGGGWLTVGSVPVDILYREIERVERVIADCEKGVYETAYHFGHPHAFLSHMYAGELATARIIHDPNGTLAALKAKVAIYPEALAQALVARFTQEAQFFLSIAWKAADKGDVTYVAGCAYRTTACLLQVLFAANRQWLINEKGALALAAKFPVTVKDLKPRMEAAYALFTPTTLRSALEQIGALVEEATALTSV